MTFSMEKRRLQFTGGTSYTVTLPKDWVLSNGLKKNDHIIIAPASDGSLIVRPVATAKSAGMGRISIRVDDMTPSAVERRLIGAYMAGFSEIEVVSEERLEDYAVELTSEFARYSAGVEVVESEPCRMVLRDFMEQSEMNPLQNLQRMKVAVRNILSDIINSMRLGSHMGMLRNRDSEVDRMRLLVLRQVNILSRCPPDPNACRLGELGSMSCLAGMMGDVGDACVSMNDVLMRFGNREAIEEMALAMDRLDVTGLFVSAVDAVLNGDALSGDDCIDACRNSESSLEVVHGMFRRFDGSDALEVNTLANAISGIFDSIVSISEWAVYSSMS